MHENDVRCAVLIVSCDKYQDLWGACLSLFRRFWKDCPYNVYLLSNTVKPEFDNVISIAIGNDVSWSDNLSEALHRIPEEYVLLYIEDLFLTDYVKSTIIERLIEWAINEDINYLRLNPTPAADKAHNDLIGIISKGSVYRSSVVFSLWKKELLKQLLVPGESAWEFEEIGTLRTDDFDDFYASNKKLIPACNTVIKGVWETKALKTIQNLGIYPDLSLRRVMSLKENVIWKLKLFRSLLFHTMPPRFRRRVKSYFR